MSHTRNKEHPSHAFRQFSTKSATIPNAVRKISRLAICLPLIITQVTSSIYAESTEGDPISQEEQLNPTDQQDTPQESANNDENPSTPEETPADAVNPEAEAIEYTLTIEHLVNYQSNGYPASRSVTETVILSEQDFTDGILALDRFVQQQPGLQVVQAGTLSLSEFNEVHEASAQIVYEPAAGWLVQVRSAANGQGVEAGGIFEGSFNDVLFVPITQIGVSVSFEYSRTGGLAGHSVSDPVQVDIQPVKNEQTGLYEAILPLTLPEAEGFRRILNPASINQYVKNPPTGSETLEQIETALQNGDYNVVVDNPALPVYYGGRDEQGNYTINPTYQNKYSDQYNQSWNEARILETDAFSAKLLGSNGANVLENPQIEITFTEEQLAQAISQPVSLTVYYRRNATWYDVHHWVARAQCGLSDLTDKQTRVVNGTEYVLMAEDTLQGRAGALTAASPRTDGLFALLGALPMVQTRIENAEVDPATGKVTTSTTVDIYYEGDAQYRVIFDTDYTYIPRQTAELGDTINLASLARPSRLGYTFGGWQYTALDGTTRDLGDRVTLDQDFLNEARIENQDGVLVLRFTPKWVPDQTEVQVILWTEDLTGMDDVQAIPEGGNSNTDRFEGYENEPVTHHPGTDGASYSNLTNFTYQIHTGTDLKNGESLIDDLQNEVETHFSQAIGSENGVDHTPLFSQDSIVITQAGIGEASSTEAAADGKTIVNVYYTRNIYTLKFHYYGSVTRNGQTSNYAVLTGVLGFAKDPTTGFIQDEEFIFDYHAPISEQNSYATFSNINQPEDMPVPQTLTIRAKYGADLREVWPVAQAGEIVNQTRMISWCPTRGKYNADYKAGSITGVTNPCIPALYGSMSSDMIADPSNPQIANHLVAYWNSAQVSVYENTMCYELSGISQSDLNLDRRGNSQREGVETVSLYTGNGINKRIYLISKDDPLLSQYHYTDLLSAELVNGQVQYGSGNQYAIRVYNNKCYAVGRRSQQVSTNTINAQSPSMIQNLISVNSTADHTGQTSGGNKPGDSTSASNPYLLFFYYDRQEFNISYRVARNNEREQELGMITIPYGAEVSSAEFGYHLDQSDKTKDEKFGWTTNQNISVCPDRSENGTKEWIFKGWSLSPSKDDLLWSVDDAEETMALTGDLVLYAIWEAPEYTVSFDLMGGIDDGDRGPILCEVPANTRYSVNGTIPRPTRNGYLFAGWMDVETGKDFDFDQQIFSDRQVQAKWMPISEESYSLTIRSLSRQLKAGADPSAYDTVILQDENGQDVTYYVLSQTIQGPSPLVDGAEYHLNPPVQAGYIPQSTLQTIILESGTESYTADFIYRPMSSREVAIRYVEAGTEDSDSPKVLREKKTGSSYFFTYPYADDVLFIQTQGYLFVNKTAEGDYQPVDQKTIQELTWIDDQGEVRDPVTVRDPDASPIITYLVAPANYTIQYQPQADLGESATQKATALLVDLNNPDQYTANGTFPIQISNPDGFSDNGKFYEFAGWRWEKIRI